jgi:hypothetical protein
MGEPEPPAQQHPHPSSPAYGPEGRNSTGYYSRRPPLAEVDTWELWQAWRRGEHKKVLPWLGLLTGFCVVLASMYSFFFFSTMLTDDLIAQVGLTIVLVVFLLALWRRISPRRGFALLVVALMLAVSGAAFVLWLAAFRLSGWNPWVAIAGTVVLGLAGLLIGLPSLNAIARSDKEG